MKDAEIDSNAKIMHSLKSFLGKASFEENDQIIENQIVSTLTSEFWTAKQRQSKNLHEVAYRACFKAALPQFFINKFSKPGDYIYDPFSGRGTTVIEAALLGRNCIANDVNPLSALLSQPRIDIVSIEMIAQRLAQIDLKSSKEDLFDLSMFYHTDSLSELINLRNYLIERNKNSEEDAIDKWIRMVATNRLTGHSSGYFSVYTLPPNQALTRERQKKINHQYQQIPTYRNIKELILKKSKQLQKDLVATDLINLKKAAMHAQYFSLDAAKTDLIESNSIQLTVTSPPFLDVVQYARDNWLRCWFNNLDVEKLSQEITMSRTIEAWNNKMCFVFKQLFRITKTGGYVAFEVGEVRKGKVVLEHEVVKLGIEAGFCCICILINAQIFTKTANIWGVTNNEKGTNSNRIVLFVKY